MLDPHAICLRDAAQRLGIPAEEVMLTRGDGAPAPWLRVRPDDRDWYFRTGVLRRDSTPPGTPGFHVNGRATRLTMDKTATKQAFADLGVPVPAGRAFDPDALYGAIAYAAGLGRPVCVKPNGGAKGRLVFPGCRASDTVAAAFERVARHHPRVLVEESVTGEAIRFFYVRPQVVGVKLGRLPGVTGDGAETIEALIAAKNAERAARAVPGHEPLPVDRNVREVLATQGLTLSSVPSPGFKVLLGFRSGSSSGAESIECAGTVHPSYAAEIEAACRTIPALRICAIDTMIADRLAPATPRNHWILECNSSPSLLNYHHPWEGRPQDVASAILRHLVAHPML